jgi:hypothetical protein
VWEYCFYSEVQLLTDNSLIRGLNDLGREGWELVTVQKEGESSIFYYFKRPVKE